MFQLRFEHIRNGFTFYTNGIIFRRKQDAEAHRKLYYRNKALNVQVVKVAKGN
jgi:hypothetical protein